MMDEDGIDEKKPFDRDSFNQEEDTQPDPDEILDVSGTGRVWSVKIPKHLMQKWTAIDEDNIHLATIRVYDIPPGAPPNTKQRFVLILPPDPNSIAEPEHYEIDMVNPVVENHLVIAERDKEGPESRARTTVLTGRIKHDCNVRPLFTEGYRKRMRERHLQANTPKRQIKRIDDVIAGGRGALNMLSSGHGDINASASSAFSGLARPKPAKGAFERFARIPRNQLLDMLFALYRERPRWSARELRIRTEQPEAYLKEILAEIADLHRSGEFNGMYELKANYSESIKSDVGFGAGMQVPQVKMDQDDDDDDDDEEDDDDDMVEVS